MAAAAAQGFRLVVNNRPDGEAPGQPASAAIEAAALAAGMDYLYAPVVGGPTPEQVRKVREAVAAANGPVLGFCRSGTRSIVTWARGEVEAGRPRDELVAQGRNAGYDLSGAI